MPTPVSELVEHLRVDVLRDVPAPQLFSDDLLVRGLNEAHKKFARVTHCYFDDSVLVSTVAGQRVYQLPEDTIFLREVILGNSYLAPYTRRAKPHLGLSGRPIAYTTDAAHRTMRVYPIPSDVYELQLFRAIAPPAIDIDSVVDLEDEWALLLCQWAAYAALRNNDPDGSNTIAAQSFYEQWGLNVQQAKMEFTRRAMGDNPSAQPRKWT